MSDKFAWHAHWPQVVRHVHAGTAQKRERWAVLTGGSCTARPHRWQLHSTRPHRWQLHSTRPHRWQLHSTRPHRWQLHSTRPHRWQLHSTPTSDRLSTPPHTSTSSHAPRTGRPAAAGALPVPWLPWRMRGAGEGGADPVSAPANGVSAAFGSLLCGDHPCEVCWEAEQGWRWHTAAGRHLLLACKAESSQAGPPQSHRQPFTEQVHRASRLFTELDCSHCVQVLRARPAVLLYPGRHARRRGVPAAGSLVACKVSSAPRLALTCSGKGTLARRLLEGASSCSGGCSAAAVGALAGRECVGESGAGEARAWAGC